MPTEGSSPAATRGLELRGGDRGLGTPKDRGPTGSGRSPTARRVDRAVWTARGGAPTRPGSTAAAAGTRSLADGQDRRPGRPGPARQPGAGARRRGGPSSSGPRPRRSGRRRRRRRTRPGSGAPRAGSRGGRRAARPTIPRSGVTVSPRPSTSAAPSARKNGTSEPRRTATRSRSWIVSAAPQASSAPSRAAAASLEPPASPAATGIRLSSRAASARRRPAGSGPARSDGLAGSGQRPQHEVVRARGPVSKPGDVERVGRRRPPAPG